LFWGYVYKNINNFIFLWLRFILQLK
jgi:hypothetical protein